MIWANRALVTGCVTGAEGVLDPMLRASARGAGDVWGLSSKFERAGLGTSLGAGDGRTAGLRKDTNVSFGLLYPRRGAVR